MQNSKHLAVTIISLLGLPCTTVFIEGLTKPIEDFFKQYELEQTKRNNEAYKTVFATLEQKAPNIQEAVYILTQALDKDGDLFDSYQSNIACAFMDYFAFNKAEFPELTQTRNSCNQALQLISNKGAKRFLDFWITTTEKSFSPNESVNIQADQEAIEQKWYNSGYEDKGKELSEQLKAAEDMIRSCFIFLGGLSNRINHFPNKNYALETSDYKELQLQLGELEKYMLEYMSHRLKPGAKLSEMKDVPEQIEEDLSAHYMQSEINNLRLACDMHKTDKENLGGILISTQKQLEESNQEVAYLKRELGQIKMSNGPLFKEGYIQGQSDLKEILDVAEYLTSAIIVYHNNLLHIPNENLPEYLEKRNIFFKRMEAYRESYSKAKTPKEKEAYNKKSPRAYVQSSDFMAFLDLYAQENHNVEDWCLLSVKVSPEALNQAYRKAVSKYNDYIDPNKQ